MAQGQLGIAHIGWVASCHLVRRVDELCRRGVRNVVFTDNVPPHFDPSAHDFTVLDLPKDLFSAPLRLVRWIEDRLKALGIDLVHAHSTHFPASLGFFIRTVPAICSPWDFVHSKDPFSPLFHRAILDQLPCGTLLDGVSFSSKPYMDDVVAKGLPAERAFWHSWGVDLAIFSPGRHAERAARLRERLGIGPDEILFLSPRTPSLPANVDIAMQAVAEFGRTRPARLVVTGHHITRESLYYERLAARPDIARTTVFMDTVRNDEDIATLYEASDIVLSLHSNDFNPATVLEAFAMERPVVTHDLRTVSFWAEHGVTGWHVPPRDVQATVAALESIARAGRETWRAMGRAGRRRVVELADFQKTMDRLPGHYRQVIRLAASSPRPPLTSYDKGLLHDICNVPDQAAAFYRQAAEAGEQRPLLAELLEEKTAMARPDKGLEYFAAKRSQAVVREMVAADGSQWPRLAKRLPLPLSLFRHDFIVAFWPLLERGDFGAVLDLTVCLADHYRTDTLEWIGETAFLFGRRFGQWERCARLLAATRDGGVSLAALACETAERLGPDHDLTPVLAARALAWSGEGGVASHPNLAALRAEVAKRARGLARP
ncbi:glycosyl transferase group 1 [Alkalidesulfovibrio alkalitolerans DSM 16529]|uniref:Glycosyl transferase group 1 n=1 Tax=Alkalidesulfovibrio alkalitolerans DSM 16529 TaxID=1121439 RepID=S7UV25_9BACT|nr:glycosyltransferase [Alkalidesulfovibrio alkalitolerans]EPR36203.1 glycosyl transferase group 1 [Alkalidesulfovibrio alkalitolerans DSM 16529]